MKHLAAVLLAAVVAAGAPAQAAQTASPQAAANSFYAAYLKLRPSGIPDGKTSATLRPLFSARLNALLKDGSAAEARYKKATKNEVPPLVEGDLFTSLFEGATSFDIGMCANAGETIANCAVRLTYKSKGEADTKWTDSVSLLREQDVWRVDDVNYGGDWAFAKRGKLSDVVKEAIEESRKPVR